MLREGGAAKTNRRVPPLSATRRIADSQYIFNDIDAVVKKFHVLPTAPHVAVTEVRPQWPNCLVDFSDIDMVVKGFLRVSYPVATGDGQTIANCPLAGEARCLP